MTQIRSPTECRPDFLNSACGGLSFFRMSAALSGHGLVHRKCPLSGAKGTHPFAPHMSAYDPKRTLANDCSFANRREVLGSAHSTKHLVRKDMKRREFITILGGT